jgi:hypothetical protein
LGIFRVVDPPMCEDLCLPRKGEAVSRIGGLSEDVYRG